MIKKPLVLKFIDKYKINIIIKGDTAIGKTHCSIMFSEMIGIDLLTYQMNQNIIFSIFTGQRILEEDLNDEEIKLIKLYLSEINGIKSKNIKINEDKTF